MTEDEGRLAPLDFAPNPGALDALCHVPEGLADGAPLVVVLHGCTQNAAVYDRGSGWSALADRHGFALLYPQQRRANNSNLCFNWYSPADARRDLVDDLVHVVDDDLGPVARQRFRVRPAKPASGAGDDGDTTLEPHQASTLRITSWLSGEPSRVRLNRSSIRQPSAVRTRLHSLTAARHRNQRSPSFSTTNE